MEIFVTTNKLFDGNTGRAIIKEIISAQEYVCDNINQIQNVNGSAHIYVRRPGSLPYYWKPVESFKVMFKY